MVKVGQSSRSRQGHAQILPIALMRVSKVFERRAHRVIDNDQLRTRRDDEAFGSERAVADDVIVLVQGSNSRHELANHAQGCADVERQAVFLGRREQLREPCAWSSVGNHGERGAVVHAVDAVHVVDARMAKAGEPAQAVSESRLERGSPQFAADVPQVDGFLTGRIGHTAPLAKTVTKQDGRRRCQGRS